MGPDRRGPELTMPASTEALVRPNWEEECRLMNAGMLENEHQMDIEFCRNNPNFLDDLEMDIELTEELGCRPPTRQAGFIDDLEIGLEAGSDPSID